MHLVSLADTAAFENIEGHLDRWKRAENHLLEKYFLHFFEDNSGNSNYENQWSLPVGIDFGILDQTTKDEIRKATAINMHLAIHETSVGERFCVVFEFEIDGIRYLSDPSYSSYNFDASNPPPEAVVVPRYGISPNLRNQFVFNWVVNFIPFKSLFYSLAFRSTIQQLEGNSSWVRAHYYPIVGDNLTSFQNLMTEDKVDEINLSFGVNLGDVLEDKDMFTLILELKQGTSVTYLDFVGACPPNCP